MLLALLLLLLLLLPLLLLLLLLLPLLLLRLLLLLVLLLALLCFHPRVNPAAWRSRPTACLPQHRPRSLTRSCACLLQAQPTRGEE